MGSFLFTRLIGASSSSCSFSSESGDAESSSSGKKRKFVMKTTTKDIKRRSRAILKSFFVEGHMSELEGDAFCRRFFLTSIYKRSNKQPPYSCSVG